MGSLLSSRGWTIIVAPADRAWETEPPADGRATLFRQKADELRALALAMGDAVARRMMLQIAETYDRLARHIAHRDDDGALDSQTDDRLSPGSSDR